MNSYSSGTGRLQDLYDALWDQLPDIGEAPPERPALEKLRRAGLASRDLFWNHLHNRHKEFRKIFGFSGRLIVRKNFECPELFYKLNLGMERLIYAAAREANMLN